MDVNLIHRVTFQDANFKDHNFLIFPIHRYVSLIYMMVEASGVEPLTYRVQNGRSTN